jgi:hypothetical protein
MGENEEGNLSNLIHNERVKYAATFVNNLGVAAFAGGVVLPLYSVDPTVAAIKIS